MFTVHCMFSCQGVLASAEPRQARPALCGRSSSRFPFSPSSYRPTCPCASPSIFQSFLSHYVTVPWDPICSLASRQAWYVGGCRPRGVSPYRLAQDAPPRGYVHSICPRIPPPGGTSIPFVPGYPPPGGTVSHVKCPRTPLLVVKSWDFRQWYCRGKGSVE